MTDDEIITFVEECYKEARDAKQYRLARNRMNNEAALGQQDWSSKQEGQSREFLPKTGIALEQFAAFFKRGMVQAGADWFEFVPPQGPKAVLNAREMRMLLASFLNRTLLEDNVVGEIHTVVTDAVKLAATESLAIFKVHGQMRPTKLFEKTPKSGLEWMLRVDLIPFEAFFEDPSGKGLFRIHVTERDLWEVHQKAVEDVYDKAAVELLVESCRLDEEQRRKAAQKGESESHPGSHRVKVKVMEFWGSLLRKDGSLAKGNCFCAIANDRIIIRKPEENPFWHGEDPFVVAPILRVAKGTQHKALFDDASQLNLAMNELFNLFLDGGIAQVWGVRQFRADFCQDAGRYSGGIPQGETINVTSSLPPGEKVLEKITEGEVPQWSMALMELLERQFAAAALSNELKMGQLPGRTVKATEIVELQQSQATVLDALVADVERSLMAPLLWKAWLTVLQHLDLVPMQRVVAAIGAEAADRLGAIQDAAERFSAVAQASQVTVRGLSAVMARVRDFQKIAALMQMVGTNPILMQAFFTKYDPAALLSYMMKVLQLDPGEFERAAQEEPRSAAMDMQSLPMFQQMMGPQSATGAPGGGVGGPGTGGQPMPAEVNQQIQPLTGMQVTQ